MSERVTPEVLRELREAAESATPGPWEANREDIETATELIVSLWSDGYRKREVDEEDARHIAAANPSNVLALLDHIEAQRAELELLSDLEIHFRYRHGLPLPPFPPQNPDAIDVIRQLDALRSRGEEPNT